MLSGIVEGGIILPRMLDDPKLLSRQIVLFRIQVTMKFLGV